MPKLLSAKLSDVGRKRKNNEDYVASFEPTDPKELQASGCLYIVADGVGGASKGERASQYAADKVLYEYYQLTSLEPADRLRKAISQVNEDIFGYAEQSERVTRMATTMVAAVVRGNTLMVANVGDSRAYLIHSGEATQITRDHSIVGEMMATGEMTEAEAQASKVKNRLTRSVGGEAEVHVQVYDPITLQPGDKVLLCTDGLTRYAMRQQITEMTAQGSPQEIAGKLIQYANKRGGADNVSVIVIAFEPVGIAEQPAIQIPQRPQPPLNWAAMETMQTEPQTPLLTNAAWRNKPKNRLARRQKDVNLFIGILAATIIIVIGLGSGAVIVLPKFGIYPFSVPATSIPSLPTNTPMLTPEPTGTATAIVPDTPMPTMFSSTALAMVKSEPVRLHKLPSNDSEPLQRYSPGALMNVLGQVQSGQWFFVEAPDGIKGWLYSGLVSFTTTPPPIPILTIVTPGTVSTVIATPTIVTPTSGQPGLCIVYAGDNAGLGITNYLSKFSLLYKQTFIYYRCEVDVNSEPKSCLSKIPLNIYNGAPVLQSYYWLVMPVPSQEACTSPGLWVANGSGQ